MMRIGIALSLLIIISTALILPEMKNEEVIFWLRSIIYFFLSVLVLIFYTGLEYIFRKASENNRMLRYLLEKSGLKKEAIDNIATNFGEKHFLPEEPKKNFEG